MNRTSVLSVSSVVKNNLLLSWLLILVIVNIIPMGNETSSSLSGNKLIVFRLDYLAHSIMILCFAWIWILSVVLGYKSLNVLQFCVLVFSAAIGLELIQLLIPWRSFNPVDLGYNVGGAVLAFVVVAMSGGKR